MLGYLKPVLRGHRVLDPFQLLGIELDDAATLRADHVIVMLMFVVVLVMSAVVAKTHLAREAGFRQEFECAIDRCLADARIFFLHEAVEIFTRKVFFSTEEDIENQIALGGPLEPFFLDMFEENFLLFFHQSGSYHSKTISVKNPGRVAGIRSVTPSIIAPSVGFTARVTPSLWEGRGGLEGRADFWLVG